MTERMRNHVFLKEVSRRDNEKILEEAIFEGKMVKNYYT